MSETTKPVRDRRDARRVLQPGLADRAVAVAPVEQARRRPRSRPRRRRAPPARARAATSSRRRRSRAGGRAARGPRAGRARPARRGRRRGPPDRLPATTPRPVVVRRRSPRAGASPPSRSRGCRRRTARRPRASAAGRRRCAARARRGRRGAGGGCRCRRSRASRARTRRPAGRAARRRRTSRRCRVGSPRADDVAHRAGAVEQHDPVVARVGDRDQAALGVVRDLAGEAQPGARRRRARHDGQRAAHERPLCPVRRRAASRSPARGRPTCPSPETWWAM